MVQEWLNALTMLSLVHKDIQLDSLVVDKFSRRHLKCLLLIDPMNAEELD